MWLLYDSVDMKYPKQANLLRRKVGACLPGAGGWGTRNDCGRVQGFFLR